MKLLRVSAFVLVFVCATSMAHAQGTLTLPRGNVSGFGTFATATSDGLDKGHGGGGSGAYFFSRLVGIEGSFRIQSFDITPTDENALSGGSLDANVFTVNAIVRIASGSVQPYVTGGVAFFANSYSIDPANEAGLAAFNFATAESVENTVGFNFGGGVDFQVSRRIGFFGEGRYFAATADTAGGLTDLITNTTSTADGTQSLNVFTISGGIRIFF